MIDRRRFLKTVAAGTAGAALAPTTALAAPGETRLVLLHTNDTHSRIEPFPDDAGRYAGLGGVARRATLVENVRRQNPHVLLLDSGDIFQGTPYFNLFGGRVEFETMSAMRYDVATLGNHDFDNGVAGLVEMLPYADFEFVSANYDCSGAPALAERVRPYTVRRVGPLRVGIFGLGIAFERLVLSALHEGVTYRDPIPVARETVQALRAEGCDYVVCLSHLGYRYEGEDRVSDRVVAQAVPGIDLILGGHTHTFMETAETVLHEHDRPTLVHQVGWAGIWLGRVEVTFGRDGGVRSASAAPLLVGSPSGPNERVG
ncbi:MAG: metallophosphatase [Rhodothermales bacterium]|nr:metallophosphatase [Rhodothermales bacterium]